ncbi:helix-turn-helix domain-containing protein [Rhizobium sp. TH2]|uniref:IclR family transcriptional regulator domain-containing protein n=1 Tax=Rhizobium sp. TH2 TaxID=2775403 RepID=UPI0021575542|nr:IclR family transcriptional regulator C-terminal domain-containing protein [Rhizobium sp. TH2]UVC08114.1 helix-turn-helix domain-containing protein [Rhizobium sp. TH2]
MTREALSRDNVGSLGKGLMVLEILAAHPAGLTLTEMAAKADMTRAAARRFLLTLVDSEFAVQDGRRFTLSPRLLSLARVWLQGSSLWTYAEPFLRDVAHRFNESSSAAVLSGEDIVYVARVPGRHILSVALHVGTRLPAWCTSMGRVLLSDLPTPELRAFLKSARIVGHTPKSITGLAELENEIGLVAQQGFAVIDEELEIGLRSIAVPIRDRTRRIVAAINISTQSSRFTPAEMKREILPHLRKAATSIEDYFVVQ